MNFDLRQAIDTLDKTSVFEIANLARPASDYLFNLILPNQNMETYDIDAGTMTIRSTMAGMTGMDSVYAPGGSAEESTMQGKTTKLTITSTLPEKFQRDLQQMLMRMTASGVDTTAAIQSSGLNFFNKIIVQSLLDREEWLKGQALFTGELDWTYQGKRLQADYNVPDENFLTARTGADSYGGTESKFWEDYHTAQEILNWSISAIICHPATLKVIMANAAVNQLQFVSSDPVTGVFQFARLVNRAGNTLLSSDPRDLITIIAYNKEGEVWDPENAGETLKVPFCPRGAILYLGSPVTESSFIVGEGGTMEPMINTPVQMGYTHVAPTVEGGGVPGRWGRLWVPQERPWQMVGDGVENMLPVIQAPKRIVVATTDLTADEDSSSSSSS